VAISWEVSVAGVVEDNAVVAGSISGGTVAKLRVRSVAELGIWSMPELGVCSITATGASSAATALGVNTDRTVTNPRRAANPRAALPFLTFAEFMPGVL